MAHETTTPAPLTIPTMGPAFGAGITAAAMAYGVERRAVAETALAVVAYGQSVTTGPFTVELTDRAELVVTPSSSAPAGTFTLTPVELACGVTLAAVIAARNGALVTGDRSTVVLARGTGPAVAAAAARMALGADGVRFDGINPYGMPCYSATS